MKGTRGREGTHGASGGSATERRDKPGRDPHPIPMGDHPGGCTLRIRHHEDVPMLAHIVLALSFSNVARSLHALRSDGNQVRECVSGRRAEVEP